MSEAVGIDGIHQVSGACDLCGTECDPATDELNVLACTFKDCVSSVYHQDCIEKYLKSIKLERNRKTGFKCPRGCGKGTNSSTTCPGRIEKSHPIHPRNEESKKRRKAKLPEVAPMRPPPPAKKDKAKPGDAKVNDLKPNGCKVKPAQQPAPARPLPLAPTPVVKQVQRKVKASQETDPKQYSDIKAQLRQQLGLPTSSDGAGDPKGLHANSAQLRSARPPAPTANAWVRPTPAPAVPTPRPLSNLRAASPLPAAHPAPYPSRAAPTHNPTPYAVALSPPPPEALDGSEYVPVGMEYAAGGDGGGLTKAQRKNLKRGEKKKKMAAVEEMSEMSMGGSMASSEQDAVAVVEQSEELELLFEMFIQALVARKVLHHIQQLSRLGFAEWQCGAAVQRCGSDLEAAVTWLLEAEPVSPEAALQQAVQTLPEVDISDNLQLLSEIQALACLPDRVLQVALVDAGGDIARCVELLAERGDIPDHALPDVLCTLGLLDTPNPSPADPLTPTASTPSLHGHPNGHHSHYGAYEADPAPWPAQQPTPPAAGPPHYSDAFSWLGSAPAATHHQPWAPAPPLQQSFSNLSMHTNADAPTPWANPHAANPAGPTDPQAAAPTSTFPNAVTNLDRYNQLVGLAPAAPAPSYNIWGAAPTSAGPPAAAAARPLDFHDFLRVRVPAPYGAAGSHSLFATGPPAGDAPQRYGMGGAAEAQAAGSPEDNDVESLMSLVLCRS